jgi:ribonuclease HII
MAPRKACRRARPRQDVDVMDISELSVDELRRRFAAEGALTARALNRLRRDPRAGVRKLHESLRRRFERLETERRRHDAMHHFEQVLWRSGLTRVAGVDEVGMGPLAGPVVAAAVVFPPGTKVDGVDDSKKLDAGERETAERLVRETGADLAIGAASVEEIDELNIYRAGLLAMRRAVLALASPPQHVLVDARTIPDLSMPQNVFTKGDGLDFSIAAASVVAKVHRDRLMVELDAAWPGYGFARHKGYATTEHQDAIRRLGPCPIHRRSFGFLAELRGECSPFFYELKARIEAAPATVMDDVAREIDARREETGEREHRKLRLFLTRRRDADAGLRRRR